MELRSQGATIVAQAGSPGPFDIVKTTIKSMPNATRMERFELFLKEMNGFKDFQRAVNLYFFVNMHDYLTTARSKNQPFTRGAAKKLHVTEVVERTKQEIMKLSLSFVMPNGKTLRDCTFGECGKMGGWMAKISKKGKPNQIVGHLIKTDAGLLAALK